MDLLDLIAVETDPTVTNPHQFTVSTDVTPEELLELSETYQPWATDTFIRYRGWSPALCNGVNRDSTHPFALFDADLRCAHTRDAACTCLGGLLARGYCFTCQWWTPICTDENTAVEAYHDHCWTGWRNLPICAQRMTPAGSRAVLPDTYPPEWEIPGAPVRTWRKKYGTRHVPAYSAWGGYDLAVLAPET